MKTTKIQNLYAAASKQDGERLPASDWNALSAAAAMAHSVINNLTGDEIVLDGNSSFASQVTTANKVYVLRDNFALGANTVTMPEGCTLRFDGGSIESGTLALRNTLLDGGVKFGASVRFASGTCRNKVSYQSWFDHDDIDAFISFMNSDSGVLTYEFTTGTYNPTLSLNMESFDYVAINGNGAALIYPASVKSPWYIGPADFSTGYSEVLTQNVMPGATTIPVTDASKFAVGDVIVIFDDATASFNPKRAYYKQGEFVGISGVDTTNNLLYLQSHIVGTYKHASEDKVSVRKLHFADCIVKDLTIKSANTYGNTPGEVADTMLGLRIVGCKASLENVAVDNFSIGITLKSCYKSRVINCRAISYHTKWGENGIDGYGLSIGNSQHVTVDGGEFVGKNHGITTGGDNDLAIVDRYITIKNTKSYSYEFAVSLDTHGNAQYIYVENNVCVGIGCGGDYVTIKNNVCIADTVPSGVDRGGISCGSYPSLNITIEDNTCKFIEAAINDDLYTYNGTFDNWTPKTDKEKCIIKGNRCEEIFLPMNSTPEHYPNSANVEYIIENCIANYVYGDTEPYRGLTSGQELSRLALAGTITVIGCKLCYNNTTTSKDLIGRKVSFINTDVLQTRYPVRARGEEVYIDSCNFDGIAEDALSEGDGGTLNNGTVEAYVTNFLKVSNSKILNKVSYVFNGVTADTKVLIHDCYFNRSTNRTDLYPIVKSAATVIMYNNIFSRNKGYFTNVAATQGGKEYYFNNFNAANGAKLGGDRDNDSMVDLVNRQS